MGYYPIFLELEGIPVLLVGGGHVALEKIGRLVDSGARVTLVAPDLIPPVRAYADDGRVRWLPRAFEDGDTAGQRFVFVATDNGEVNRRVVDEARAAGTLVNAADDVDNCDFILPSVVRKGPLQIAASTAGTSPPWRGGCASGSPSSSPTTSRSSPRCSATSAVRYAPATASALAAASAR